MRKRATQGCWGMTEGKKKIMHELKSRRRGGRWRQRWEEWGVKAEGVKFFLHITRVQ